MSQLQLDLTVANQRFALEFDSRALADRAVRRYTGFLAPLSAPPDFTLRVTVNASPSASHHPEHVANPVVHAAGSMDRASLSGPDFAGELDWRAGRGWARIPDALSHLDLFLRVSLGVHLLRNDGLLLHASGVLRDGFAIAFAGPSGAGKTTIARICRGLGLPVLADEMLAFRRVGVGARFFGAPFWNGGPQSGPAGALLFLSQAPQHAVRRLPPAPALPRLLAAGGAPLDLPVVHAAFFERCAALLRRTPAYVLEFAPDPGFWSALDALPEFSFFRPRRAPAACSAPGVGG